MKLIPRFSLRLMWIALTIFLIVFAVGVSYWRAYQEHERVASKLETLGFDVEEEYDTLFGWVIAKRITGLQGSVSSSQSSEVATALMEIPNKLALGRLSCKNSFSKFYDDSLQPEERIIAQNHELLLMRVIGQLTSLEQLDIRLPRIAPGQLQELASLKQLRSLQFYESRLPVGEVRSLLEQLPNLEQLLINEPTNWLNSQNEEVLGAKLPNLRLLRINQLKLPSPLSNPRKYSGSAEPIEGLDLTRQGIGRYPNLEYLILDGIRFKQVVLEAGAMPRLKILDLSGAEEDATVNWAELPRAAPSLQGIAIHKTQLTKSVVNLLDQFPLLQSLHVEGMSRRYIRTLQEQWKLQPETIDTSEISYEILNDLFARYVPLQFPVSEHELWYSIPEDDIRMNWPSWDIKQYRTKPKPSGGGFF